MLVTVRKHLRLALRTQPRSGMKDSEWVSHSSGERRDGWENLGNARSAQVAAGQRSAQIVLPTTPANDLWTFPPPSPTMTALPPDEPDQGIISAAIFMIKKPAAIAPVASQPAASETEQQRFERILLRPQFKPLKAVIDKLQMDSALMNAALVTTNSYQMFLGKLGYRVEVVKQLHEQDCYTRLGPKGGIRAVVPLHNPATYSTMLTLVNFDASVTTTAKSVDYYDDQLAEFKTQLMSRSGNAG